MRLVLLSGSGPSELSSRLESLRAGEHPPEPSSPEQGALRAAIVAADREELSAKAESIEGWLSEGESDRLRVGRGIALAVARERPRLGFLFPGQGAPVTTDGGYLEELLPGAAAMYRQASWLSDGEVPASLVQLSVVTASLAGLRALAELGVDADLGVGHSVGELTALHWAGAINEDDVFELARRRGEIMTEHATEQGAMANIEAEDATFARIVDGADVTVACFNSPLNRVISGTEGAIEAVVQRARGQDGARALKLPVVGAFHSPLMNEAAPVFERVLSEQAFGALQRPVFSTISGGRIAAGDDVAELLSRQVTEPVLFLNAVRAADDDADLLIEVGPGRMLSGLVSEFSSVPSVALRVGHSSAQGLLSAVGAAWALGADVNVDLLPDA